MKLAILALSLKVIAAYIAAMLSGGDVYSVWTNNGWHLMICDNGTPLDFDDDYIIDWETGRDVIVTILDR